MVRAFFTSFLRIFATHYNGHYILKIKFGALAFAKAKNVRILARIMKIIAKKEIKL